jgi:hypothetical protein
MTPVFDRAKAFHTLNRVTTVWSWVLWFQYNARKYISIKNKPRGKQNSHTGFDILTAVTEICLAAIH